MRKMPLSGATSCHSSALHFAWANCSSVSGVVAWIIAKPATHPIMTRLLIYRPARSRPRTEPFLARRSNKTAKKHMVSPATPAPQIRAMEDADIVDTPLCVCMANNTTDQGRCVVRLVFYLFARIHVLVGLAEAQSFDAPATALE